MSWWTSWRRSRGSGSPSGTISPPPRACGAAIVTTAGCGRCWAGSRRCRSRTGCAAPTNGSASVSCRRAGSGQPSWSPSSMSRSAKHALELAWHEAHPDEGQDERISTYKKLVIGRLRQRQWALLGDVAGKRVLDVGCGVGRETVALARRGAQVVAVDL